MDLRPHQEYIISEVLKAIDDYNYIFINAPTGSGKTLIALLIANELHATRGTLTLVATRTRNEFIPYFRDINKFGVPLEFTALVGKQDACSNSFLRYILSQLEDVNPCRLCPLYQSLMEPILLIKTIKSDQSVENILKMTSICPYYSLRKSLTYADFATLTYPYIFTGRRELILDDMLEDTRRGYDLLLIIDEAHNIENITSLYQRSLDINTLSAILELISTGRICLPYDEYKSLHEFVDSCRSEKEKLIPKQLIPVVSIRELADVLRDELEVAMMTGKVKIAVMLQRVLKFMTAINSNDFEVFSYEDGIRAKMILPRPLFSFLDPFRNVIMMSGTLPPEDYIKYVWGLVGKYIDITKKYDTFRRNRVAYIVDDLTTKYTLRSMMYSKYVVALVRLFEAIKTLKLVVFPSYEVMERIISLLPKDILSRTVIEDEKLRIEEVKRQVDAGKDIILAVAGGKLTEGIEITDEKGKSLITDVIMVGVPYPDVNDYQKVRGQKIVELLGNNKDLFRYLYHIPAVILTKQAIGRAVRSSEDKVRVLLLDRRFRYMIPELDITMGVMRKIE